MLSSVSPDVAPLAIFAALVSELLVTSCVWVCVDTDASCEHLYCFDVYYLY